MVHAKARTYYAQTCATANEMLRNRHAGKNEAVCAWKYAGLQPDNRVQDFSMIFMSPSCGGLTVFFRLPFPQAYAMWLQYATLCEGLNPRNFRGSPRSGRNILAPCVYHGVALRSREAWGQMINKNNRSLRRMAA
ncbi:MAG: hypothetical protein A2X45_17655 [Lentisphaerae bacterium GWF2_50_93]|nr:MAG: hypothetical protein A2X45_17655 [Lentisphaerae bacterium GWF2_50_93]